jgi:hypothetical protein
LVTFDSLIVSRFYENIAGNGTEKHSAQAPQTQNVANQVGGAFSRQPVKSCCRERGDLLPAAIEPRKAPACKKRWVSAAAHRKSEGLRGLRTMKKFLQPEPIVVDPHFSPQFYAELWGMSVSTATRWFQDLEGVLKLSKSVKNGKRSRIEFRIPYSLAMRVYRERTRSAIE